MKNRDLYRNRIEPFVGKNIIKVITGQRRVGKSYFMKGIAEEVRINSPNTAVIYINKEELEFDSIVDYKSLVLYVEGKTTASKIALFIDEVQEIFEFEKALRHFHTKDKYDIYCTGSNAQLLSGELATLLSGRSIEIEINTLSYPEFLYFHELTETSENFETYAIFGGMPNLIHFSLSEEVVYDYLKNLYNTIIVKDVISRYAIRNVSFLRNLSLFMADNIGSVITAKSISDYLKAQKIKMTNNMVQDYLLYLSNAFFIHKVNRSDLKGKRLFEIGEKYYFNDIGMRNALVGYKTTDMGKILENIVFQHLKVAGYSITVGKDRDKEIDFVAQKKSEILYVQVTYLLSSQKTIDREFGNLQKIHNNYPKMVVSMDRSSAATFEGIKHLHIRDFCMSIIDTDGK